jgi:crotonobetainyl-CoA:carnitine CoA-transferase CaiB-like acyl-CoA transferase
VRSRVKEMLAEASAAVPRLDPAGALAPFAYGSSLTVNSPNWIRGQEKAKPRPAPAVGEHSEEVLRAAGFEETEIRALRAEGVIA